MSLLRQGGETGDHEDGAGRRAYDDVNRMDTTSIDGRGSSVRTLYFICCSVCSSVNKQSDALACQKYQSRNHHNNDAHSHTHCLVCSSVNKHCDVLACQKYQSRNHHTNACCCCYHCCELFSSHYLLLPRYLEEATPPLLSRCSDPQYKTYCSVRERRA